MIEILEQCHCENPALEEAKKKGLELVCPDCHKWRKPKFIYPESPSPIESLKGLALIQRCVDLAVEADMRWQLEANGEGG